MITVRKFAGAEALTDRQIRAVASDESLDRTGDIMAMRGCDLTAYRKAPIVLFNHDASTPVGTAQAEIDYSASQLMATITFAPPGVSEKAAEVCGLCKSGVLGSLSVGFTPIASEPIKGGGYRFTKWELLELSIVSIPANPNARITTRAAQPTFTKALRTMFASTGRFGNMPPIWGGNSLQFIADMRTHLE